MVGTEQESLEYKEISWSWSLLQLHLVLLDFSFFFSDHFFLFILASVAANHKIATNSDVLNKTAGVLKYGPDKIGAVVVEKW